MAAGTCGGSGNWTELAGRSATSTSNFGAYETLWYLLKPTSGTKRYTGDGGGAETTASLTTVGVGAPKLLVNCDKSGPPA